MHLKEIKRSPLEYIVDATGLENTPDSYDTILILFGVKKTKKMQNGVILESMDG